MNHINFNYKTHGFVGHLAEPEGGSDRAVIVIMGGEKSLLPGIKFAERFADYGIIGLAVSLYDGEGLPESPDRIPVDMVVPAVQYLRNERHVEKISVYGQSMGSIFAVLAAQYIGGFENLIMVSPTHVPFGGTLKDKKTMSGHSVATWQGEDIPYVKADFSRVKAGKYQKHPDAKCKVTGMWVAYHDAYQDAGAVQKARLKIADTNARILLIAGDEDEAWPAEYSVQELLRDLQQAGYEKEVKTIIYPHGSHLNGLMPNKDREKKLYRMLPLIGFMYKTFGKYKKENLRYFQQSEQEIIDWIKK